MILIGNGIDYHKLTKQKTSIVLGGVKILSKFKIIAHSDGDIVLHSISNSILGALGKGDIGDYFSDKNICNKNINSLKIVKHCLNKMSTNSIITNIDITVICDKIILKQHKELIKKNIIKIIKCKKVNLKFTRFENNSNLIGCFSTLLIKK